MESKTNVFDARVTLYKFRATKRNLNFSPFCIKLETYLRMTKIPFKSVYGFNPSSKGKLPWIEYQDKQVADSNFCIEFLSKEFAVDIDEHLTAEERAVSRALMVMLEENTYWTLMYFIWCTDFAYTVRDEGFTFIPSLVRKVFFWRVQAGAKEKLNAHGMGRHSEDEIYQIAERDLRVVSTQLGKKKFLFGDKPCVTDASLFGTVSLFLWECVPSPQGKLIREHLPNLAEHAQRMKDLYYPDWDKIIEEHQPPT